MNFKIKAKKAAADIGEITTSVGTGIVEGVKIGVAFMPVIIALAIISRL